jgi:hypothetical protein
MTTTRYAVGLAAAFLANAHVPALAADATPETDAGPGNHYILPCEENCADGVIDGRIGPAFTGAWYNPAHSGHGLFIEILPGNRIQAIWFAFNPAGTEQAWFVGAGTYAGRVATINAVVQPSGGRWIPNFDPSHVVANPWGSLLLSFSDIDHGRVDFKSISGYGTGTMNLTRLTATAAASGLSSIRTGSLNVARVGHAATLLPNGKVLAVGGFQAVGTPPHGDVVDDPYGDTAELYDPATGTWRLTGKLNFARGEGITATLLEDGNVLVTGGWSGCTPGCAGPSKTAEVYEAGTETWRLTGSMHVGRAHHSATLLSDGKVLVVGGGASELYDPATGSWSSAGAPHSADRYAHSATLLQDGRVLVFGGGHWDYEWYATWVPETTFELYEPVIDKWTQYDATAGGMPIFPGGEAVLLRDGIVLSAGGPNYYINYYGNPGAHDTFLFNPATLAWTRAAALGIARYGHTATVLRGDDVLVAGGSRIHNDAVDEVERFDTRAKRWIPAGRLGMPRIGHSATLLADGSVLFAGGYALVDSYDRIPSRESELRVDLSQPPSTIRPGFTGSWYDPAQSGHGLHIEVLPDNRFLAAWFTFSPVGTEQAWFLGVGDYSGNTATIDSVVQPTGGAWIPNFDRSRVVNNPWGTLTFTFADCGHGRVDFDSIRGYGKGSMNLTRLTQPDGLACP